MQHGLVGAYHAGAVGLRQRLGLRAGVLRAERVVVEQEQRDDHRGAADASPHRVRVLRGDHVELAAPRHQVLVSFLAAQLDRIRTVGPQVVVAGYPHHGAEPAAERPQRPFDVGDLLGHVTDDQEPVSRRAGRQVLDPLPVPGVGDVQVADGQELSWRTRCVGHAG
jgi:hypothetical protein